MIVMKSMEFDDEDKLDAMLPIPMPDRPDYPYGLRICLTEKELEKLGIDCAEACVGGTFYGHFMACITTVSSEKREDKDCCRIEAQITDLAIESEDEENNEAEKEM